MGRYGGPDIRPPPTVRSIATKTEDMIQAGSDPVPPGFPLPPPGVRRPRSFPLARMLKRGLDMAVAATSIFLLLPLMLLVAGTIWAVDRGSPIVRETSLGCGGSTFGRLRFRTTVPVPGVPLDAPDGPPTSGEAIRVTAIGRVLAQTSLDELPTLLNVLRGEMSLVGPRPIMEAAARHEPDLDAHLSMPPGLTGAWQVEGSPGATEAERAKLDLDYARGWSLRRDLAILLRAVADAFARPNGR